MYPFYDTVPIMINLKTKITNYWIPIHTGTKPLCCMGIHVSVQAGS